MRSLKKRNPAWLPVAGAVTWINHPHMPQAIPMANLIGLPPFEDGTPRATAPSKGQHSVAIMREHGYSDAEIADLTGRGVLVQGA